MEKLTSALLEVMSNKQTKTTLLKYQVFFNMKKVNM